MQFIQSTRFGTTVSPITFSGSLSGAGATATILGTSRTITVPAGNSGQFQVRNLVTGSGTPQKKLNGAGFTNIVNNNIYTLANGNSFQCRGITMTASTTISFDLYDVDTNTLIIAVGLIRA